MSRELIEQCRGRWFDILTSIGVPTASLNKKHGPCPLCGGKDRFRWDDKNGDGSFYCNQCGPGYGMHLVMKFKGIDRSAAVDLVGRLVGTAQKHDIVPPLSPAERRVSLNKLWASGKMVTADDPVGLYLRSRLGRFVASTELRCVQWGAGAMMVARVIDPRTKKTVTLHRTFLTLDGRKSLQGNAARKLMPGSIPKGVAVRLMPHEKVLGIAEGIETAMAAAILFNVPVWSALNANFLTTWQVPDDVETVMVFGDNDANFVGQAAAYEQAKRCALAKKTVQVRIPDGIGDDWADVLTRQLECRELAA